MQNKLPSKVTEFENFYNGKKRMLAESMVGDPSFKVTDFYVKGFF
jgi:hypothetical protein